MSGETGGTSATPHPLSQNLTGSQPRRAQEMPRSASSAQNEKRVCPNLVHDSPKYAEKGRT